MGMTKNWLQTSEKKFADEKLPHQSSVLTPKKFHFRSLPFDFRLTDAMKGDYGFFFLTPSNTAQQDVVIKPKWWEKQKLIHHSPWSTFNAGRRGRRLIEKRLFICIQIDTWQCGWPQATCSCPRRQRKCIFRRNKNEISVVRTAFRCCRREEAKKRVLIPYASAKCISFPSASHVHIKRTRKHEI